MVSNQMSNRRNRTETPAPERARDQEEPTADEAEQGGPPAEEASEPEDVALDATSQELAEEVDRLQGELNALNDRHLRLAAEFDNFRRRSHNQLGESSVRAQASLVAKLLDVVDDFDRVTALDPETATVDSVLEGVELVERKLRRVLDDAGLEPIDPVGQPFDPNSMEAIMRESASSQKEDETVGTVLQRGYSFRGHLVRPARVSVRKHDR